MEDFEGLVKIVKELETGFLIVGGENELAYGTLDFETLFVWTSREKAEEFIEKNLEKKEDSVKEMPIQEIYLWARNNRFKNVRFDFVAIGATPNQMFMHKKI